MKKTKMEKGITLIALIITIVVLLILAVVAIRAVQGDGIIFHAKNSATKYSAAQTAEQMQLLELEYELQKAKGETTSTKAEYVLQKVYGDKIGIGTKVAYNSGVEGYSEEWAVLGVENGQLMLLSQSIGTKTLSGAEGYINGVKELNEMCAPYGKGKGATGARSIKVEDINTITGFNPANISLIGAPAGANGPGEYGSKVTFEIKNGNISVIGSNGYNNDGSTVAVKSFRKLNGEELVNNSGETYTETNSYYNYLFGYSAKINGSSVREDAILPNGNKFEYVPKKLSNFLIYFDQNTASNKYCWLANQSVLASSKHTLSWGLMMFANHGNNSTLQREFLYNSNAEAGTNKDGIGTYTNHVRAVVYLEPGIKLVDTNNDGIYEI